MDIISIAEDTDKLVELEKLAKEKQIFRTDRPYLNRFLYGHQHDINSSFKALCNYQSFVDRRRDTWLKIDNKKLTMVMESQVLDVLENTGLMEQKIVWIRLEKWDPHLFSSDDILEASGLICEAIYANGLSIKYIDIIIDLRNFQFQHLYALSTRFAKRMVFFLSECLPMQLLNVYIVREPRFFCLLYAVFKPFIAEKMKKAIHICGENYELLAENIGIKTLPREFKGMSVNRHSSRWLDFFYKPKTIQELRQSGYQIN